MGHQRDCIGLVLGCWLSAGTAILGIAMSAGCTHVAVRDGPGASPEVLTLSPYVGRLRTVTVTVNGKPVTLLFDTGGGQTLVTPAVAERVGCRADGVSTGFRMSGERVTFRQCGRVELGLGDVTRELSSLAVFDLNALLPAELPRLDGLLALDALATNPFTLELGANRLTLESASSLRARIAEATPVDMRVATGVDGGSASVFLSARAPSGQNLWLELDSGNLATVLLATHVRVDDGTSAATAGHVPLTLGGISTAPLAYERRELILDGALNAEFLERYAVTIDMVQGRAWIATAR